MTAPSSDLLTRYAGFATNLGFDLEGAHSS
jgi:hypothetical protein